MALAAHEDLVQALGAYGVYPSFGISIRSWCLGRDLDYLGTGRGEHSVEGSAELSVAVADEEPEPGGVLVQVDEQVAGGLGDPGASRVGGGDAGQVDPAVLQFNEEQDVQAGQADGFDGQEVARDRPGGLGPQELHPASRVAAKTCRLPAVWAGLWS